VTARAGITAAPGGNPHSRLELGRACCYSRLPELLPLIARGRLARGCAMIGSPRAVNRAHTSSNACELMSAGSEDSSLTRLRLRVSWPRGVTHA
jgi:hypothetical protein